MLCCIEYHVARWLSALVSTINGTFMKNKFAICIVVSCFLFISITGSADWRNDSIKRYEEADAELDHVFQKLVMEIKNKHPNDPFLNEWIEQITRAQESWKKYRDADEQSAGFFWRGGGTEWIGDWIGDVH
jgi:hypothetical protein